VPLTVTVDGVDHLEGVDLDADEFYSHFRPDHRPDVSTSQPAPGRFVDAYRRLADRGCDEIVSVHLTASMSGTLASAAIAAGDAPVPVHLVDSGTASFGISCCVWAAALAVRSGADVDEVVAAAAGVAPRIGTTFVVGVPALAEKGGRAAGLDLSGDAIPVLAMDGGQLRVLARVSTVGAAVVTMVDYALGHGPRLNVAIGTSDGSSAPVTQALVDALEAADAVDEIVHYRIGPSIGAHTGPGTAGLFVFPAA
jgi:DegV family protein with EDD domain